MREKQKTLRQIIIIILFIFMCKSLTAISRNRYNIHESDKDNDVLWVCAGIKSYSVGMRKNNIGFGFGVARDYAGADIYAIHDETGLFFSLGAYPPFLTGGIGIQIKATDILYVGCEYHGLRGVGCLVGFDF